MDGVRVVTLTEGELVGLLERAAAAAVEKALARVLPPFSQHTLPEGVSARAFLAACRDGCPHTKKGRTLFVERTAWATWLAARPMRGPLNVHVRQHPPAANMLDPAALLEEASRGRT